MHKPRALDLDTLIDAVMADDVERVRARLLHYGINLKDADGNTALHHVRSPVVLVLLLAEVPDRMIRNHAGQTAEARLVAEQRVQLAAIIQMFYNLPVPLRL
jgi:hypothetical protein